MAASVPSGASVDGGDQWREKRAAGDVELAGGDPWHGGKGQSGPGPYGFSQYGGPGPVRRHVGGGGGGGFHDDFLAAGPPAATQGVPGHYMNRYRVRGPAIGGTAGEGFVGGNGSGHFGGGDGSNQKMIDEDLVATMEQIEALNAQLAGLTGGHNSSRWQSGGGSPTHGGQAGSPWSTAAMPRSVSPHPLGRQVPEMYPRAAA